MTVVDTNILLDVLLAGAAHGDDSERRLAAALAAGPLCVNHIIAAEIAPVFTREADLWEALAKAQIRLDPYPRDAVYLAGHAFLAYRRRGGTRQRILTGLHDRRPCTGNGRRSPHARPWILPQVFSALATPPVVSRMGEG